MTRHDVFISYSRAGSGPAARRLVEDLARDGVSAFLDQQEVPWGAPFPAVLAGALQHCRVAVILADRSYFGRPWCVHEFRFLTTEERSQRTGSGLGIVVALPPDASRAEVLSQLPPAWAARAWPSLDQPEALHRSVLDALSATPSTFADRFNADADETVRLIRSGADHPLPWSTVPPGPDHPLPKVWSLTDAPGVRGDGLIGRSAALWWLAHELVTARAFSPARRVVLRGLGGCGKSLLAAEFVARYAPQFFPAGVIWINADAGPSALADRLEGLWSKLAPGRSLPAGLDTRPEARVQALLASLGELFSERTVPGALLWVIDGLPEPRAGTVRGIADFCPAPLHLSVLVTTRWADTVRDAHATLPLAPLGEKFAVELLTRPDVQRRWLSDEEWTAIARWCGSLPLVLSLLRNSLLRGGLTLAALKEAPRAEPAATSERLREALRGEVDDDSLRGAVEAYELSWQALASEPALAEAAQAIALLAPVGLSESFLDCVIGSGRVGKLVGRGWMEPAQTTDPAQRAFAMHRVPASVLRVKAEQGDAAFAALFAGLAKAFEQPDRAESARQLALHLDTVARRFFSAPQRPSEESVQAAKQLTLAAARLGHPSQRGLRFLAGRLACELGADEAFVEALAAQVDPAAEDAVAALPHTLQALPSSRAAMGWYAQLLADLRPAVRYQAIVHAPPAASLAHPLLEAILSEERDFTSSYRSLLEDPAMLRTHLSNLLAARSVPDPRRQIRAARLLGDLLVLHGRQFAAGGYSGPWLVRGLLQAAGDASDDTVADELARAAARGVGALDDGGWQFLCESVEKADDPSLPRIWRTVGIYLDETLKPPPPDFQVAWDDVGNATLSGKLPAGSPWPGHVVPRLIDWVLRLPPAAAREAARILVAHPQGLAESATWVHARLDQREFGAVLGFAEALGAVKPDFVNAPWWRAQARIGLGRDEEAVPDLETVMAMCPDFDDARQELAGASRRIGGRHVTELAFDKALPWLERAAAHAPDDFEVQHLRALALFNLQRFPDAEAAATRAIQLRPEVGEAWFFRAVAKGAAGRPLEAWPDIQKAAELTPGDERIMNYRREIESWMARVEIPAPARE